MSPAFRSKSGSRGKIQLRYVQGRRASSVSQRHTVVVLIASTMSRATATRAISATERRARGRPRSAGRSQASALISTTTRGGKGPRPAASRTIDKARLASLEEALAPLARGRADDPTARCDLVVAQPIGGQKHDPRALDGRLAGGRPAERALQCRTFARRQLDPVRAPSRHPSLLPGGIVAATASYVYGVEKTCTKRLIVASPRSRRSRRAWRSPSV